MFFGSKPYGNCGKRLSGLGNFTDLIIDFTRKRFVVFKLPEATALVYIFSEYLRGILS